MHYIFALFLFLIAVYLFGCAALLDFKSMFLGKLKRFSLLTIFRGWGYNIFKYIISHKLYQGFANFYLTVAYFDNNVEKQYYL